MSKTNKIKLKLKKKVIWDNKKLITLPANKIYIIVVHIATLVPNKYKYIRRRRKINYK